MLSHDNLFWNRVSGHYSAFVRGGNPRPEEDARAICYLPMSHIGGSLAGIYHPMYVAAKEGIGFCVYFARMRSWQTTLLQTLKDVKPTGFFGFSFPLFSFFVCPRAPFAASALAVSGLPVLTKPPVSTPKRRGYHVS